MTMSELPKDVADALLQNAKNWILGNYWGNQKKLSNPAENREHYRFLLGLRSGSLGDSRQRNLRRMRKLVEQGLLIERPHYRSDRRSCDFTVPTAEQADAIYDQAVREWQAAGYVLGELMPAINSDD
jgi:hypothetical protein